MAVEIFTNDGAATVTAGGTTAPAQGTVESWTLSGSTLPAVSSSANLPTQCYVADTAATPEPEKILVTNITGATATVTRGADSTTPIAHTTPYTIQQVAAGASLRALQPTAGSTAGGVNVNAAVFGAIGDNGTTTTNNVGIQAAINAVGLSGGGIVTLNPGTFYITQAIQLRTGVWLQGSGQGVTTIKAINNYAATQVGTNTGLVMLATFNNGSTAVTNIKVTGITFDGNQANVSALPGYADDPESAPVSLWNCDQVLIERCSVINSIGYNIYLNNATHFTVRNNNVLSGQGGSSWGNQDGIHITATTTTQYGVITGNFVDTGVLAVGGDDCIALQVYGTMSDIIVSGNVLRGSGGGNGLTVPMSATNCVASNIVIVGNDFQSSQNSGIYIYEDAGSTPWVTENITISNNTFAGWNGTGSGNAGIALFADWKDAVISGNTIAAPTSNAGGVFGILVSTGTNVAITGNRVAGISGTGSAGIQVGNTGATGVTGFTVASNVITCTAASVSGIVIENSVNGAVTGNMATGVTGGTSYGVELLGNGTAVTGVAVTGNRLTGFVNGAAEVNTSGAGAHNTCVGNALNGCTNGVVLFTGTGDLIASNGT